MYYANIELYVSHYLDEYLFKNRTFMEAFNFAQLKDFMFEKPQERYPELVRIFYATLSNKDGIINFEVKKNLVTLSLEDFEIFCNLTLKHFLTLSSLIPLLEFHPSSLLGSSALTVD